MKRQNPVELFFEDRPKFHQRNPVIGDLHWQRQKYKAYWVILLLQQLKNFVQDK